MLKNMIKLTILSLMALAIIGNTICSEEATDEQMGIALTVAARFGDAQRVDEILRAFPHLVDYDRDYTPLCIAAGKGWQSVVVTLLRHGAQIDKVRMGSTPLNSAAQRGKTTIIRILLEHGANIEQPGVLGDSPLSIAAEKGHFDACVMLLQHGANIDSINDCGYTPLHRATQQGHENVVKLLLEHDANVNIRDKEGHTPLALLFDGYAWRINGSIRSHLAIAELLISYGAEITDAIDQLIRRRLPFYTARIEAALLFERQRRALLKHTSMPVEVINFIFTLGGECYEDQQCSHCRTKIRQLPTPELNFCESPFYIKCTNRFCADCDRQRQEHNDHTCPVCSNTAQ